MFEIIPVFHPRYPLILSLLLLSPSHPTLDSTRQAIYAARKSLRMLARTCCHNHGRPIPEPDQYSILFHLYVPEPKQNVFSKRPLMIPPPARILDSWLFTLNPQPSSQPPVLPANAPSCDNSIQKSSSDARPKRTYPPLFEHSRRAQEVCRSSLHTP